MNKQRLGATNNHIAIVIGCSEYASGELSNLRYAEKDANAIAERLRNPEIGRFKDIYAFNSNSSLRDIEVTIDKVLSASLSDDKVVIYFSGHGIKHPDTGQLYLAVNETDKQAPRHTAIHANGLLEQLEESRSSRKCVILDCCYSGAFGRKGSNVEMLDYDKDLEPHEGKGVVVLASSKAYEESLESERHGHSLFTHYLLEGMDGAADENEDGVITPGELYAYAYDRVRDEAAGEMSPKIPLNRLEGPEFYLVHNPHREQKTLKTWREKIKTMQDQYHHLQALEWLDTKIRNFGDEPPPISKELTKLHQQVEKNLCKKWRNYKVRLNGEWGKGLISRGLLDRAEEYINGDPEFMFSDVFQTDPLALDLRQHLVGDIDGHALNKRWPRERLQQRISTPGKNPENPEHQDPAQIPQDADNQNKLPGEEKPATLDQPDPPQTTHETGNQDKPTDRPAKATPKQRLLRWTLFIAGIGIIVLVIFLTRNPPVFDPQQIRFGISARDINWDKTIAYLMEEFRDELNQALEDKGSNYRLASTPVRQFKGTGGHFNDMADALLEGEIDLLGELTPREIYKLSGRTTLLPFIGPKYAPAPSERAETFYRTVLFGLADNYSQDKSLHRKELVKKMMTGKQIVVAGKESTSGYWWPRHWVLQNMQSADLSFSDISIMEDDAREILREVICNPGVAAGALAEFRYKRLIDDNGGPRNEDDRPVALDCGASNDARILDIRMLEGIPNGAYVLGALAAEQEGLNTILQSVWQQAIHQLHEREERCANDLDSCDLRLPSSKPITRKKIDRYLPSQWVNRNLGDYTDGMIKDVFNTNDPNANRRSRTIYYLLIVCAVILVIGLTAATLLRKNKPSES